MRHEAPFSLFLLLLLSSDFFYCTLSLFLFFPRSRSGDSWRPHWSLAARGRDTARPRVSLIKIRNNRRQSYRGPAASRGDPHPPLDVAVTSRRVASSRDLRTLFTGARSPVPFSFLPRAICLPCFSTRSRRICHVARRRLCVFKANAESMTAYLAAFQSARAKSLRAAPSEISETGQEENHSRRIA